MNPTATSPTATNPTIVVHDVHKHYASGGATTPVLQGIDLEIFPGECVFLVGPSGSGKTTLLSILGCLLTPDRGRVEILGREISGLSNLERAMLRRDQIGFVFQQFHLIRGLTSAENVALPLTLSGTAPKHARRRALELLESVGLAEKAQAHVGNLSTGQCQRVALARALAGDPQLILADEPTASLDGANGQEAMQLLRKLTSEAGKTAVVVTHDARIYPFADRILELEGGRIAQTQVAPALRDGGDGRGREGVTRRKDAAPCDDVNQLLQLAQSLSEELPPSENPTPRGASFDVALVTLKEPPPRRLVRQERKFDS